MAEIKSFRANKILKRSNYRFYISSLAMLLLLEKEKEFWDYVLRDSKPPLALPSL